MTERIPKPSFRSRVSQEQNSLFGPPPVTVQAKQDSQSSPLPTDTAKALQFGPNFASIPVYSPGKQVLAPAGIQPSRAGVPQPFPQQTIAPQGGGISLVQRSLPRVKINQIHPVVAQRAPARQIQRMMSAKEFQKLSGTKQSNLLKRIGSTIIDQGSTYDGIITLLQEYDALREKDPGLYEGTKRLEILTDLLIQIGKWNDSDNRGTQSKIEAKMAETDKSIALDKLAAEIQAERIKIRKVAKKPGEESKTTQQGASSSVTAAIDEQKSFFGKVGEKFGYTFGLDFRVKDMVALNTETLTFDEMELVIHVVERAIQTEEALLGGDPPLEAAEASRQAYEHLPVQLKPRTSDPEEKLVLMTKVQLLKESVAVEKEKQAAKSAKRQKKAGKTTATVEPKGQKIRENELKQGELSKAIGGVMAVGSYASKAGKGISAATKSIVKAVSPSDRETISNLTEATSLLATIGTVFDIIKLTYDFAQGDIRYLMDKDKTRKRLATEALADFAVSLLDKSVTFSRSLVVVLTAFEVIPIPGIAPLIGALNDLIAIVQSIIQGVILLQRAAKEEQLEQRATDEKSGLATVLGGMKSRNFTLAVREGINIVLHAITGALKIAGGILAIVADAGGGMGGASTAIAAAASLMTILTGTIQNLCIMISEGYRAGVHQEAQQEAEAGISGSAKKVLGTSPTYAATALILEAKKNNPIAVEALEHYNINPQQIKDSSTPDLRDLVMSKLQENSDAKTIGQKISEPLYKLGIISVRL